jgi:hypothetical protein
MRGRERTWNRREEGMWHLVAVAKVQLIQSPPGDQRTNPARDPSEYENDFLVRYRRINGETTTRVRDSGRTCPTSQPEDAHSEWKD